MDEMEKSCNSEEGYWRACETGSAKTNIWGR